MIPKIVHYCWFGRNPLPPLAKRCIASWQKYLPDYQIKEWNEDNFDVNEIPYIREAYEAHKYAFVSDYARFKILYDFGGLYFDTDVELIRPVNDIILRGPFMGCEMSGGKSSFFSVNPGLGLGSVAGLPLYKEILDLYRSIHFKQGNGTYSQKTVVEYVTEILYRRGLQEERNIQKVFGVYVYPKEYFCPLFGKYIDFTKNTRSIHHYMSSWKKYGFGKRCKMEVLRKVVSLQKKRIALFG